MWANLVAPFPSRRLHFHPGPLPGEPRGAAFLEVDGVRLRCREAGEGPAVLLIHGFAASLGIWRCTMPALVPQHRVLAADLKGFGWSGRPAGDYSHEAQAALLWKFLDARGVGQVALVGHSWGCAVALAMALRFPGRVRRLALHAAWVYQEQLPPFLPWTLTAGLGESLFSLYYREQTRYRLLLAFHDRRFVTGELVDDLERALSQPGSAAAALASLRAMDFAAQQASYPRLEMPVQLLWGREDAITSVIVAERLRRDLRARLCLYPRCGHFPMIEAEPAATRDLAGFLAEDR